ncbi:Uncharacterised protein [uncultured archaeon]|nr:Uncharacterised protein [uncultured archaeon]
MKEDLAKAGFAFGVSENYVDLVTKAITNNEGYLIENSSKEHAKFLIYSLFLTAKKSLKIFSGSLNESFYADKNILDLFNKKLEDNVTIEIVVEKKERTNPLFNINSPNLTIRQTKLKSNKNHFILADDSFFRMEKVHTSGFPNEVQAIAMFKKTNISDGLVSAFNELR